MGSHVVAVSTAVPDQSTDTADVRGRRSPWRLQYPPGSVVVLAGVPGAGKTTLLRRLFPAGADTAEARVLDSDQVRTRLARVLRAVPYPLYRPVVHLAHYARIGRAITQRDRRAVIIHDTGTRPLLRRWITSLARGHGRPVHLLLLDVPAEDARSGQVSRARRVSSRRFARHVATWREVRGAAVHRPADLGDYDSHVLLDRRAASGLRHIAFTGCTGDVTICQAMR